MPGHCDPGNHGPLRLGCPSHVSRVSSPLNATRSPKGSRVLEGRFLATLCTPSTPMVWQLLIERLARMNCRVVPALSSVHPIDVHVQSVQQYAFTSGGRLRKTRKRKPDPPVLFQKRGRSARSAITGYFGVRRERANRYGARVNRKSLGTYDTAEEAAHAYDGAALRDNKSALVPPQFRWGPPLSTTKTPY